MHGIAKRLLLGSIGAMMTLSNATAASAQEDFRWGAASSSYQVEGHSMADGKGRSVWDVYMDDWHIGGPGITGQTAINFYDRETYLKDIALFKKVGLKSYRFSISWPRIIPDGLGPVNPARVAHYRRFIEDLKAAGIKPMLTLYHWEMPASLAAAGGWENRDSITWFQRYAEAVFANFADQVDTFVLVNEPSVERAAKTFAETFRDTGKGRLSILPDDDHMAVSLKTYNHLLLAAAAAKKSFDDHGYKGQLGIAMPFFPIQSAKNATADDKKVGELADGILNRWFLDAMYKGSYPTDVLAMAKARGLDIGVLPDDAATIGKAKFDYLGVNYYGPLYIRRPERPKTDFSSEVFLPEGSKLAFNGEVRPDLFRNLLNWVRTDYGNPPVYITENGAGFGGEDVLKEGRVEDVDRCKFLVDHIAAMKAAMADGADVRGYHVWSSHDNLEFMNGYASRFGMIYVDWNTQQRTLKRSGEVYSRIVKGETVTASDCGGQ